MRRCQEINRHRIQSRPRCQDKLSGQIYIRMHGNCTITRKCTLYVQEHFHGLWQAARSDNDKKRWSNRDAGFFITQEGRNPANVPLLHTKSLV
eukprot:3164013-Amphidinium_carterae.1